LTCFVELDCSLILSIILFSYLVYCLLILGHKCGEEVLGGLERVVFRGEVYHGRCLKCAHCGSGMREGTGGEGGLHVTFDGGPCCSVHCLQMYDAKNIHQLRK